MNILLLTKEDMQKVITMREAIQANKEALAIYSCGEKDIPIRTNLDIQEFEGQSLYMPGYAKAANALGVKIVSVYPKNAEKGIPSVPSTMILVDDQTGQVNSLMDGTYLTQLRTGALAGAATDLLARQDAKKFVLIGTGGQAPSQLEAVLAVRSIQEVKVFSRQTAKAKEFVEKMKQQFNVAISISTDLTEDIKTADIITTVTTAKNPVFDGTNLKPGVHINGVGSYTPEMIEIPPEVLKQADKIYVDTKDAITESGDFQSLITKNRFNESKVTGELGELIAGKALGRENDQEITFFKTTGNAILDIVVAKKVYDNAKQDGIGNLVEL